MVSDPHERITRPDCPRANNSRARQVSDSGVFSWSMCGCGCGTHRLVPGERIADRFVVREVIGEGASAEVWLADDDQDASHQVALKVATCTQFCRGTFTDEERALRALSGSGIKAPSLIAAGEHDGAPFLALERVNGHGLRDLLRGPLSLSVTAIIVSQVACALETLHARGWIHADVKPDNLMMDLDGETWLVDFGLATRDDLVDAPVLGSPSYIAPEHIHGHAVGPSLDQFALAVTAVELLTGEPPWVGASPVGTLAQILHQAPDLSGVPERARAVLERGLSLDPAARFSSVGAFAEALAGCDLCDA